MNRLDLTKYSDLFTGYTELRVQENRNNGIVLVDGNILGNSRASASGVSARTYVKGSWGFSSSPETDSEAIRQVIKSASENALFLDRHENRGEPDLSVSSAVGDWDFTTKKAVTSQKDRIDFAKNIDNYIKSRFAKLSSRTVVLNGLDMEKQLLTSTGSRAFSMTPRSLMYVVMAVDSESGPVELYEATGSLGQFEDVFIQPSDYYEKLDKLYEHLLRKAEGVFPRAGVSECILAPDLAGILAHEAIGHTTEADIVRGGSVAADFMNQEVASPLVNMVDFAHTAMG